MNAVLVPSTLDEALAMLAEHPSTLVMAGGTDLLVRLRGSAPGNAPALLSLARVEELQLIDEETTFLAIGAATSFSRIIDDPLTNRHAPLLVQAARTIGGPAIRNMATIGGNIGTASPAGDSLPPLYVLGARIELASPAGKRALPIAAFILGPGRTALRKDEIITRILLPKTPPWTRECFAKIGRRRALAISMASFAGLVRLDRNGRIAEIRMTWGSVGPTVVRLAALEAELAGAPVDAAALAQVHRAVLNGVAPISDLRASARYRGIVAANLAAGFVEGLRD